MSAIRDTIARVAEEEGIDPAYALSVAERESNFKPNAGGTGTIRGLFQLTGANRRRYGQTDDADVEEQTRAFARLTHALRQEMTAKLGREPSPGELYTGHHFGGTRAARIITTQGDLSPSDIFSAREMAGNPHFSRARTGGELSQSIVADIDKRMTKHGGGAPPGGQPGSDYASHGQPVDVASNENAKGYAGHDFAEHGEPIDVASNPDGKDIDYSQHGQPVERASNNLGPPEDEGRKVGFGGFSGQQSQQQPASSTATDWARLSREMLAEEKRKDARWNKAPESENVDDRREQPREEIDPLQDALQAKLNTRMRLAQPLPPPTPLADAAGYQQAGMPPMMAQAPPIPMIVTRQRAMQPIPGVQMPPLPSLPQIPQFGGLGLQ